MLRLFHTKRVVAYGRCMWFVIQLFVCAYNLLWCHVACFCCFHAVAFYVVRMAFVVAYNFCSVVLFVVLSYVCVLCGCIYFVGASFSSLWMHMVFDVCLYGCVMWFPIVVVRCVIFCCGSIW